MSVGPGRCFFLVLLCDLTGSGRTLSQTVPDPSRPSTSPPPPPTSAETVTAESATLTTTYSISVTFDLDFTAMSQTSSDSLRDSLVAPFCDRISAAGIPCDTRTLVPVLSAGSGGTTLATVRLLSGTAEAKATACANDIARNPIAAAPGVDSYDVLLSSMTKTTTVDSGSGGTTNMSALEVLAAFVIAAGVFTGLVFLVRARVRRQQKQRDAEQALSALPGDGHIPPTRGKNRPEVTVSPTGELKHSWAQQPREEGPPQLYAVLVPKGEAHEVHQPDPVTDYDSLAHTHPPHTAAAVWHGAGAYAKLQLGPATRQPAANDDNRYDALPTPLLVLPPRRQVSADSGQYADITLAAPAHPGSTTADEDTGDATLQSAPRRPTPLSKDHPLNATAMAPGAAHQPPMEVVDGVELTKQEATNVRLRRISDDGIMSLMRDARLRMEKRRNCDDPGSQAIPAASGATLSLWAQLMRLEQDPTGNIAPGAPDFHPPLSSKSAPVDCKYIWVEASEQIDDDTARVALPDTTTDAPACRRRSRSTSHDAILGHFDGHGVPAHVAQYAAHHDTYSRAEGAYGLYPSEGTDSMYDHPCDVVNPLYMAPSSSSSTLPEPLYNQPESATGTDAAQAEPTSPDCQSIPVGRRSPPDPMAGDASAAEVAAVEVAFYSKLLLSHVSHEKQKIRRGTDWNAPSSPSSTWAVANRIEDSASETAGDAQDCQSVPVTRRSSPEELVPMRDAPVGRATRPQMRDAPEGRATRPPSYIRPPSIVWTLPPN